MTVPVAASFPRDDNQDHTIVHLAVQVGNIQLGIPVRVTRRNKEEDALSGHVFIYDGLYNVVSCREVKPQAISNPVGVDFDPAKVIGVGKCGVLLLFVLFRSTIQVRYWVQKSNWGSRSL